MSYIYLIIIITSWLAFLAIGYFFYRKYTVLIKKYDSVQAEITEKNQALENLQAKQVEYQKNQSKHIQDSYQQIPTFSEMNKMLGDVYKELKFIKDNLSDINSNLVESFTGIISKIGGIVDGTMGVINNAEVELLSFISQNQSAETPENILKKEEHKEQSIVDKEFLNYIQNKYNGLLKQIIEELVITHKSKLEDIDSLDGISKKIKTIIPLSEEVSEIASGIELISLNASIEAAYAGDKGKGFSVIASEIRKLATQSEEASLKIKKEINATNDHIGKSIHAIKEAMGIESSYINSTIAIIQDVFLAMTETLFRLIHELTGSLMNSVGDTSEIKQDIYSVINSLQFENFIVKISELIDNKLNTISSHIDSLSAEELDVLYSSGQYSDDVLNELKKQLLVLDKEIDSVYENTTAETEEDDITFF